MQLASSWIKILLTVPFLLSVQDGGDAERQVAALAGDDPDAAVTALVTLEPAVTLPLLVNCVASAPEEHAWQAMRALRRIGASDSRDRSLKTAATGLTALARDAEEPLARRVIAALSIGPFGDHAKSCAGDLNELLDEDPSSRVRAASAIALGELGKGALSELKKNLRDTKDPVRGQWNLVAIGCKGEDGKALVKSLLDLIQRKKCFQSSLLCSSALDIVHSLGETKRADKAWEKRLDLEKGKVWGMVGRFNYGGMGLENPRSFIEFMSQQAGLGQPADLGSFWLPDTPEEPINGNRYTVADAVRSFVRHQVAQFIIVHEHLTQDEFRKYQEYEDHTRGLFLLTDWVQNFLPR